MNLRSSRDERERSVDAAADRLAYVVLSFGVLIVVAYRAVAESAPSWDLLGLVILAGAIGTAYRMRLRVVTRGWLIAGVGAAIAAAVAAGLLVILRP